MTRLTTLVLPFAVAMLLAAPAAAQAQAQAGPGFGQHVSHCAQTMGFDADLNPGMHRMHHGLGGWEGMSC